MFSVYGKTGRTFRGPMEAMPRIGPVASLLRSKTVGSADLDRNIADAVDHFAEHPAVDLNHRVAAAAYAHTATPEPDRRPLSRVSGVMTRRVVTIASTATVGEAWGLLMREHLGQAPVVGEDRVLVGLLSRADLLHPDRLPGPQSPAVLWQALLARSVVDLMWTPVPSVSGDADIRRVARVLLDTGLPGLPVVDDAGLVVGFVSRSDILRAVVADPPLDLWT